MRQVLRAGVRTLRPRAAHCVWQTRGVQIRAAPTEQPGPATAQDEQLSVARDARFDVVGSSNSLLSVSLSASQNLFTRKGTLVAVSGKADNVVSSLSPLEPIGRVVVGIPFLYQKISSASPVTALISVRSSITSFSVIHLNGSVDWMVAQRRALLAWTGHSLSIRPMINTSLTVGHWGSSQVTGRGLLALVGKGQIYSVELKQGEQYIAHPGNVVAYTMNSSRPRPYRFKSTTLNFQVPGLKTLPSLLQKSKFIRAMSDTDTWKTSMKIFHKLRTWSRMTIWGDRLFLQFDGPSTILLQTRGPRVNDILSEQDVNEIADSPRGVTVEPGKQQPKDAETSENIEETPGAASVSSRPVEELEQEVQGKSQGFASVTRGGDVKFERPDQKS